MLSSLWWGRHALQSRSELSNNLWQLLSGAGAEVIFITDCERSALLAEEAGCPNSCLLQLPLAARVADQTSECTVAHFFAEAAAQIGAWLSAMDGSFSSGQGGRLIWVHCSGLKIPWDAPLTLRARFADFEDPEPPKEVGPPNSEITGATDPDWILGWGQVAAAQTAVIDESLELLYGWISQQLPTSGWCVLGLGGVPLGEHGWLGWGRSQPYHEQLQVPAILTMHPRIPIGYRRPEICQLADLGATIAEMCGLVFPEDCWGKSMLGSTGDLPPQRWPHQFRIAVLSEKEHSWIRVPAWSLLFDDRGREALFVKPDDRWEVSDVSNRCPEVVTELRALTDRFVQACRDGNRMLLPELNDHLCILLR
jgi:hypothetical protein